MSKSLETEYKASIRAGLPDLWDRIEAGLDAQEAEKKNSSITGFPQKAAEEKQAAAATDHDLTGEQVKKKTVFRLRYLGVAAAAAICLLAVVPVMRNMRNAQNYTGMAADSAAAATQSVGAADPAESAVVADAVAEVMMETETASVEEACRSDEKSPAANGGDQDAIRFQGTGSNSLTVYEPGASAEDDSVSIVVESGENRQERAEESAETAGAVMLMHARTECRLVLEKGTAETETEKFAEEMKQYAEDVLGSGDTHFEAGTEQDCLLTIAGEWPADRISELQDKLMQYDFVTEFTVLIYDEKNAVVAELHQYRDRRD